MVDLTLDAPGNHDFSRSVDAEGIRIGHECFRGTLIVSADQLITGWPPSVMEQLQEQHLQALFDLRPELVLLGTGNKQIFLPPRLMVKFYQNNVGIEVMTTDAACRTFNVLVSEGRKVVAAPMPINP